MDDGGVDLADGAQALWVMALDLRAIEDETKALHCGQWWAQILLVKMLVSPILLASCKFAK